MPSVTWIEKIGEGAHAQVWKAEDDLGRIVAVKILDSSLGYFGNAVVHARALARVQHSNVVSIYYVSDVPHPVTGVAVTAIVMEYLEGSRLDLSLRAHLFSIDDMRSIGRQMLAGLAEIHNAGLAHGDFHAGNIIISGSSVKIIDILYLDTLELLSTTSRDTRIGRDLTQLKLLLADLIDRSELDFGVVREFNTSVSGALTISQISEAFEAATEVASSNSLEKRVEFAFERFTDPHFVKSESYSAALDDETTDDVVFPLVVRIIGDGVATQQHSRYLRSLWNRLTADQRLEVVKLAAEGLDANLPGKKWLPFIACLSAFGETAWDLMPKVRRLRIESIITQSILEGRHDIYMPIRRAGQLGTWAGAVGEYFEDRDKLVDSLCTMLRQNWYTQNYVGENFMKLLPKLADTPKRERRIKQALRVAIANDARVVKQNLFVLPFSWTGDGLV